MCSKYSITYNNCIWEKAIKPDLSILIIPTFVIQYIKLVEIMILKTKHITEFSDTAPM